MPMHKATHKTVSALAIICAVAALVWIALPRSGPIDSPFIRQMSAMQQICKKLRDYDYKHSSIKPEDIAGRNITDYVAIGILTPEDAAYIRDREITFEGFDPNKIGGDIPVLEAIYRKTGHPKRIIGYSDASVRFFPLDN
jgi:hypothetical protein